MHIIKSKERLKETSVNDVLYPRDKNKIYFQNTNMEDKLDTLLLKRQLDEVKEALPIDTSRKTYNENIRNLDPRYTNLTPQGTVIVRMELIEDEITTQGIILPKLNTVEAKRQSGVGSDQIRDPFNFKKTAIIVATPPHFKDLTPGTRVQLADMQVHSRGQEVLGYDYNYVHPDYNDKLVPQSVTHPDFGYAIIPTSMIKVVINEA